MTGVLQRPLGLNLRQVAEQQTKEYIKKESDWCVCVVYVGGEVTRRTHLMAKSDTAIVGQRRVEGCLGGLR